VISVGMDEEEGEKEKEEEDLGPDFTGSVEVAKGFV
jgi:hypothetical protein